MIKTRSSLFKVLGVTLILLLIPLIASLISDEVHWNINDFILMGFMVFTTGTIGINVLKVIKNKKIRWITITLLCLMFLLVWAELAVGIFDTPFAGSWKNTSPCRLYPKTYKKSAYGVFKALTNVFYKSQIKQTYDLWNSKRFLIIRYCSIRNTKRLLNKTPLQKKSP